MQFLVRIEAALPPSLPEAEKTRLLQDELARGRELVAEGALTAVWAVKGGLRNVGIWRAADETALHELLGTLPLAEWITAEVTPLLPLDLGQSFGADER